MSTDEKLQYQREWRARNKEKNRAYDRKYYEADKARKQAVSRARQQEYRAANYPKIKARMDEWRTRPGVKDRINKNQRERYLPRVYGITEEEKAQMLVTQGGCAACGGQEPRSKKGWVVDHCHKSGDVRGILCQACNVTLGKFSEDPEQLRALARYIEKFK